MLIVKRIPEYIFTITRDFIGVVLAPLAYRGVNVAGKKTSLNASYVYRYVTDGAPRL